jgi:predicted membrane-bound spermidine synthase
VSNKKSDSDNQGMAAKLVPFLYLTAAINGGVILIVEILGAKMLSPYFGTSHFVWTAQIAATLISLAFGYYYGGRMADRKPHLARLFYAMLFASIYLAIATLALEPVAYFFLKFKLAMGSLLMALFLFFPPLTLLAITIPFLARITTQTTQTIGVQVGRLSAISTFGSVVGTVLISYVLIPHLPNTYTMLMVVGLEIVLVVLYFLMFEKGFKKAPGVLPGIAAGILLSMVAGRVESVKSSGFGKELFRKNSNFGLMQVVDSDAGDVRYYLNDFLTQNIHDPKADKSLTVFTYMLHGLTHAYHAAPEKVLCIGLGVGIVPMQLANEGSDVEVVEINPGVVEIGEQFFGLDPSKLDLHIGDGRYFLNASEELYDVVVLDAFLGDSSPSHLMSRECFESMAKRMKEDSILVINAFGHFDPGEDFFMASLDKTLQSVFGTVHIHDGTRGNVFFVASRKENLEPHQAMDMTDVHPRILAFVETAWKNKMESNPDSGIILTDDYNPVEYYDANTREEIRLNFALNMRGK